MTYDVARAYSDEWIARMKRELAADYLTVARALVSSLKPASVADIGCGPGLLLEPLVDEGVPVIYGCDGSSASLARVREDLRAKTWLMDLRYDRPPPGRFDLVACLEVAEHIEEEYSERLVETLTSLGPMIFFSAAAPGQGGEWHVNLRPLEYWDAIFARHGYALDWRTYHDWRQAISAPIHSAWWLLRNVVFFRQVQPGVQRT